MLSKPHLYIENTRGICYRPNVYGKEETKAWITVLLIREMGGEGKRDLETDEVYLL